MANPRHSGSAPTAGDKVGRWTLLDSLGVGGMATVWRAAPTNGTGDVVALKILHQARVTTEEVRRLKREFLTLNRLDHPRIVKVIDAGEHDGFPWLALHYVAGCDLGALIDRWKQAEPPDRFARAAGITRQVADALAYVHEKGIVHRDLKPGNVLVDESGEAWLTDFGVVKDVESFTTNLTVAGRLVGTVAFMAPEQITGDPVDHRADLYGLGALLYTMITGRRPVVADSIAGYLARQLAEMPKAPIEVEPRVPVRLDRVCMRLLQKEPAARYASARDVLAALDAPAEGAALPVHGQAAALKRVDARLDELAMGVGGALCLVGPAGSGRTRLLGEVAARARARGLAVAREAQAPADALVRLVDDADLAPHDVRAAVGDALRRSFAAGTPVLLVMSVESSTAAAVAELAGAAPLDDVAVAPLDREGVRALLRDHGASGGLGAALTRRLGAELGGWAGRIVAQFDALVDAGWLARGPDGNVRAVRTIDQLRTDPLPIPAREREAIVARLGRMSREERRVAEAAAILAMPTSAEVLAATAGVSDASRPVASLTQGGVFRTRVEGLQELVEIASPRIAQATRDALSPGQAAGLHAAAARALKERYGQRGGAIAELVALHLERAGLPQEARPLLVQAAQAALRRGDLAAARPLAERAMALERPAAAVEGEDERLRRQSRAILGDCLRAAGRLKHAREVWLSALSLPGGTEAERGRLLCTGAVAAAEMGDLDAALSDLDPGLRRLPQGDPAWAEAAHVAAELALSRGDRAGALARWDNVAAFARESRNAGAALLADYGRALADNSAAAPAEALWTALTERALAAGRSSLIANCALRLGLIRLDRGDGPGAGALADHLAQAAEPHDWWEVAMAAAALRAQLLAAAGDEAGALAAAAEALTPLLAGESRALLLASPAMRARVQIEDAPDLAHWLDAGACRVAPPWDADAMRRVLVAGAIQRSRPKAAGEAAAQVVARVGAAGPAAGRVRLDAARVLAPAGRPAEARRALAGQAGALRSAGWDGLAAEIESLVAGLA